MAHKRTKLVFFEGRKDYTPIIVDCPRWMHEKKIAVTMPYCGECPFRSAWHIDGPECQFENPEWHEMLRWRKEQRTKIIEATR